MRWFPQQFFPALGVTFVAYPTSRLGEEGPAGERFLDNRRIDGPIPRMIAPLLDTFRRNMKRRAVVKEGFRQDIWEVRLLRDRGQLSADEIAQALRVNDEGARRWLRILRKEGIVVTTTQSPRSPKTKYRLTTRRRARTHK